MSVSRSFVNEKWSQYYNLKKKLINLVLLGNVEFVLQISHIIVNSLSWKDQANATALQITPLLERH